MRIGLRELAPDVDWVLSGINQGGNLGADVFYSGTVAAVREGVLEGVPGNRRFPSTARRTLPIDWTLSARWARPLLKELLQTSMVRRELLEHQPAPPGARLPRPQDRVLSPGDVSPLPVTYRKESDCFLYAGNYHQRRYAPGTDVEACFRGDIAVTRVRLK